jgi:hypothetical protein
MVWGVFRVTIFVIAFLCGALLASFFPLMGTSAAGEAQLPGVGGTSLLVTCDEGSPTVQQLRGSTSVIEVKCALSDMQVVETKPTPRRQRPQRLFDPIAAFISNALSHHPE